MLAGLLSAGTVLAAPGHFSECAGGRIEEAASGRVVDFAHVAGRAAAADHVLFGERHGIPEQAAASACLLSAMAGDERPVTVVMEMLASDDDGAIERYRADHPESAAGLGVALKWWDRGWPAYENWLPLIDRAFGLRAPLRGGDLSAEAARADGLTPREGKAAGKRLGPALAAVRESWGKAMAAAHCGLLSPAQTAVEADRQIRRDLSIADKAEAAHAAGHRVLLQVGRGHSRRDRSLYQALSREKAVVLAIGAYAEGEAVGAGERALYDYVWIAGKANLTDPCKFTGATNTAGEPASR